MRRVTVGLISFIFLVHILIPIPITWRIDAPKVSDFPLGYTISLTDEQNGTRTRAEMNWFDDLSDGSGIDHEENVTVVGGHARIEDNVMIPDEYTRGLWHFDDDSGDIARDFSGLGNNGTIEGAKITDGVMDNSLGFDGVNDLVTVPYTNALNFGTSSFSITGWFKTPGVGPGGNISVRVATQNDDAEEQGANPPGRMDLTSSDLEIVYNWDKGDQHVGMRFQDIDIPPGATIANAYIEFQCDETGSDVTNLRFYGEDTDDALTFTSDSFDISNRPKTSNYVSWNSVPPWNTEGEKHRTPDLSPVIQELVDRNGWSQGNDLAIIVTGSGVRRAEAYDGEELGAPLLVVDYVFEQYVVSRYDSDQGFKIWLNPQGQLSFGIDDDATWGPDDSATSPDSYDDNEWHNFAAVKEHTNGIRLYVDGEQVAFDSSLITTDTLSSDSARFIIGSDGPITSDHFEGSLDELCISNSAVTQEQAAYNARLFRSRGTVSSNTIALPDHSVWDYATFRRDIPTGTYLNISVIDALTGEELITDNGRSSNGFIELGHLNPLERSAIRLEADLRASREETPMLLEWGVYWRKAEAPILSRDIPPVSILEDTLHELVLDLSEYFVDSYSVFQQPSYSIDHVSNDHNISLSMNRSLLEIDYLEENWTGNITIGVSCVNMLDISTSAPPFEIVVLNVNDPPSCWPVFPTHETIWEKVNITVYWDAFDIDSELDNISYDLFLGKDYPPPLVASNIEGSNHSFENLVDGTTYYWCVKANDGEPGGESRSDIWSFSIDRYIPIPETTLVFPRHTAVIDSTAVTLRWDSTDPNNETMVYHIFFSMVTEELVERATTYETSFLITDLEIGEIYYWKVVPVTGSYEGVCTSGVWTFYINDSFSPVIEFDLLSDTSDIAIREDGNAAFNITIRNNGNAPTLLSFAADGPLADYVLLPNPTIAEMGVDMIMSVNLNLSGRTNESRVEPGSYELVIRGSNNNQTKSLSFTVKVTEGETKTDDDDDTKNRDTGGKDSNNTTCLLVFIVLVLLIAVIVVYYVKRRGEEQEHIEPEEKGFDYDHPYREAPEGYVPIFSNPRYEPEYLIWNKKGNYSMEDRIDEK